jgi:hypothetical protein
MFVFAMAGSRLLVNIIVLRCPLNSGTLAAITLVILIGILRLHGRCR